MTHVCQWLFVNSSMSVHAFLAADEWKRGARRCGARSSLAGRTRAFSRARVLFALFLCHFPAFEGEFWWNILVYSWKYVGKMENRRITEVEGKGVSNYISVTVNQAFNWLIILVVYRSSTRNKTAFFFTGLKNTAQVSTLKEYAEISYSQFKLKFLVNIEWNIYHWRWIRWRNEFWPPVRNDWGIWPGKPWDTCTGIKPLSFNQLDQQQQQKKNLMISTKTLFVYYLDVQVQFRLHVCWDSIKDHPSIKDGYISHNS